ncbi:MAG: transposase [Polyangiaceae bacterium]
MCRRANGCVRFRGASACSLATISTCVRRSSARSRRRSRALSAGARSASCRSGRGGRAHGRDHLRAEFDSALRPVLASCYAAAGGGEGAARRPGRPTHDAARAPRGRARRRARRHHRRVQRARRSRSPPAIARLERLCRYLARPPLAQERLTALADGRLRYEMKTLGDGTYAVVLEPLELMSRLAAMVPPPRFHMIPFHGVVSSHSSLRSRVVPEPPPESGVNIREVQLSLSFDEESAAPSRRPRAWLLRHVFQLDVTSCPQCNAEMRWVEVATTPNAFARLLAKHALAARPPPHERPSPPGQLKLPFDA